MSAVEIATFVLAVVGTVLAVAGLVWQAATWVLEGGRARVHLVVGAASPTGRGMVTGPPHNVTDASMRRLAQQGYTIPVVGFDVTNTGRSQLTVKRLSIRHVASGLEYFSLDEIIGQPLPHRLGAHESETWAMPLRLVAALIEGSTVIKDNGNRDVVGVVELGDKRKHVTKERIS